MGKKKVVKKAPPVLKEAKNEWRPYQDGLLIKKVTEEERQQLHDAKLIYGWDPKTHEAIVKEGTIR